MFGRVLAEIELGGAERADRRAETLFLHDGASGVAPQMMLLIEDLFRGPRATLVCRVLSLSAIAAQVLVDIQVIRDDARRLIPTRGHTELIARYCSRS